MMASVQIHGDGSISFDATGNIYLGCTTTEGLFPPTGKKYTNFLFRPKIGTSGILAFQYYSDSSRGTFHHFFWDGPKLILKNELPRSSRWCESAEHGLMAPGGNCWYVTKWKKGQEDHTYKVVDLILMLRYILGEVELKDLARASVMHRAQIKREQRMRDLEIVTRQLLKDNGVYQQMGAALSEELHRVRGESGITISMLERDFEIFHDLAIALNYSNFEMGMSRISGLKRWLLDWCWPRAHNALMVANKKFAELQMEKFK